MHFLLLLAQHLHFRRFVIAVTTTTTTATPNVARLLLISILLPQAISRFPFAMQSMRATYGLLSQRILTADLPTSLVHLVRSIVFSFYFCLFKICMLLFLCCLLSSFVA